MDQFDAEIVVQWIEEDVERRLPLIVHAVSVGDQSLASLARAILTRYRHRKDVRSALGATFGTGGWMGSESEWRAGKVSQLEEWAKDPNPNVRQWALELKQYHLNNLKRAQSLNEEEDSR